MGKKLTDVEKKFIKDVAKDSYDMKINVEDIRKAFQLLTDDGMANIKTMRQKMFTIHNDPDLLEEKIYGQLPTPERFLKKQAESEEKPKTEEVIKIDKRSKEYRDSLKNNQ